MKNITRLIIFALCLVILGTPTDAKRKKDPPGFVPLVAAQRKGFTNCMWSREQSTMGTTPVNYNIMGLGGEHESSMAYEIKGKYTVLETLIGYSASVPDGRSAIFEIMCDGKPVERFGPISSGSEPETVRVPIKNCQILTLRILPQGYNSTHGAMWGEPKLWYNCDETDFEGTLIVNVNGRSVQAVPNTTPKGKEIELPVPILPGMHEFKVVTNYDEKAGRLDVTTVDMGYPGNH